MADRALRDAEFIGRERHAATAGRRFKRDEAVKWRKGSHDGSMKEIHADVNRRSPLADATSLDREGRSHAGKPASGHIR